MNINTGRSEAFSDGVIAIIITIMVFNIRFPDLSHEATNADVRRALVSMLPRLLAYVASFVVIGIMWLNHHHMFHLVRIVDERLSWLNLHFLFWLSLIPFPTGMLGANPLLAESAAIYGGEMLMVTISFTMLRLYIKNKHLMEQGDREIDKKIRRVNRIALLKNLAGTTAYAASIPVAFYSIYLSFALFAVQPVLLFIPDGVDEAGDAVNEQEEKMESSPDD